MINAGAAVVEYRNTGKANNQYTQEAIKGGAEAILTAVGGPELGLAIGVVKLAEMDTDKMRTMAWNNYIGFKENGRMESANKSLELYIQFGGQLPEKPTPIIKAKW